MTTLNWECDSVGVWTASRFNDRWPDSYLLVWFDTEVGLWESRCVNPGTVSDSLGVFHTREEALQRCHEFITPKPPSHGGMSCYYKASPQVEKQTRVRLLFET